MIITCPRCGAETTSSVYCQICNDFLQAQLDAAEVLDFAAQWSIEHFQVKTSQKPYVNAWLAEMPREDAEVYAVNVFVSESVGEVRLSIEEGVDGFTVTICP
ncbi:MAG: hypothetical protein NVSMB38_14450 [Ktedonobacteraceae bacterium]